VDGCGWRRLVSNVHMLASDHRPPPLQAAHHDRPDFASPPELEKRLTDLEVKACYLEDLVESLNTLVYRQQQHLDSLTRELLRLREQGALHASDAGGTGFRSLRDEIPPHY
jgi:SlyX protein